jgi:hypothetical protein
MAGSCAHGKKPSCSLTNIGFLANLLLDSEELTYIKEFVRLTRTEGQLQGKY